MKELLYIDKQRLDRYSAQVNPSLSRVEKTKELGAEFALTGPKASFGQKERVRPLTDFEKMDAILLSLKNRKDLLVSRPDTDEEGPAFVCESCVSVKVVIPHGASGGDHKNPEFSIWFSAAPEGSRSATLCLLEDYRGDDDRPVSFRHASTYTLLQSLIHYSRSRRLRSLLDDHVRDDPHPNPYANFDGKPDSLAQYHNVRQYAYEFATDPVSLLRGWGCLVSAPRAIEVLYRIREFGRDSAHSWERVTVFGYPIWITAD